LVRYLNRPDLLVEQVKKMTSMDRSERQRMGKNGREYVLEHFSKEICLPKVIQILEEASR